MASVRFMDQQVGRLMEALERLGIREETIVIFMSDHGYNLGEYDSWSKASLWEGSISMPLIISDPKYKKSYGTSNETITELIDLYPTLAERCGFSEQKPDILQGKSLMDYIKDSRKTDEEASAYTIVTYGGQGASLTTKRWKYTRWGEKIQEKGMRSFMIM
jgi:iduronate 2-sulfatase